MSENKEDSGKVQKTFESNMKKLTALLGGETMYKPLKAAPEDLKEALAVLVKEEKEALITKIVNEARKLIQDKREFDKFVSIQRKELEKKVETKQKEFNESSKTLFGMVQNMGALEKSYYETLLAASEGKEMKQEDPEPDPDEKD